MFVGCGLLTMAARKVTLRLLHDYSIFVLLPSDETVTTSSLSVPPGNQMGLRCSHLVFQYDMCYDHLCELLDCTLKRNNATLEVSSICDVHTSTGHYQDMILPGVHYSTIITLNCLLK